MNGNPLIALQRYGQSVWYDNIRPGLITAGELGRLIEKDGLRGVTSNPTIFEKVISGSTDYDAVMQALVAQMARSAGFS
ncbi:MAG: transaldolase family protein [Candidatus Entotheonellia bacterium]